MTARHGLFSFLWLVAAGTSCSVDLGLNEFTFACQTDADCALGKICDRTTQTCLTTTRTDAGVSDGGNCGFEETVFDLTSEDKAWEANGAAWSHDGYLDLTSQSLVAIWGNIWRLETVFADSFRYEMEFSIGGGPGGEGMAMAWIEDGPFTRGRGPGSFGVVNTATGYMIEIDTFDNGSDDPPVPHIGLARIAATEVESIATSTAIGDLRVASIRHTVALDFDHGLAQILLDDELIITASVAGYRPFAATFGVGASVNPNGSRWDDHVVYRVTLICR